MNKIVNLADVISYKKETSKKVEDLYDLISTCLIEKNPVNDEDLIILTKKPTFEKAGSIAYIWTPDKLGSSISMNKIKKTFTLRTLHSWAYYGFFKPDLLEVISQVPQELRFEIDDTKEQKVYVTTTYAGFWKMNESYHEGITTFYFV